MGYSKSVRNKMSNDQGDLFENLINQACLYYKNKDIAMIEKTPEPFRVMKKLDKEQLVVRPIGKAQPDYKGTLRGGRAIVFEAKMTGKDRIQKSVITKHQGDCLDLHEEMGAVAGVCCLVGKVAAFVPWQVWKNMKEQYGRQYMTVEELAAYQVPTFGYIDFLHDVEVSK